MSKRFRFFCDEVKVRELIVYQHRNGFYTGRRYWFQSNKLINYNDSISPEIFQSYRSVLKFDQNLRRLHLNVAKSICFKIEVFNSLLQLEQLEIECDCVDNYTLTLPNLKIFKLRAPIQHDRQLKMKTPKLEALDCYNLRSIEIDQPETIKHLRIDYFHSELEELVNLEVLECAQFENINKEILSILSNLKVLCCYGPIVQNMRIEERLNLINNISFIMKQKLVLRRTELKVYLQGVQLIDGNDLNTFKLNLEDTRFQIENYANLYNSLYFITYVNYSDLIALMKQVPDDYFNKFSQIRKVEVTAKVDADHFIWFVSKLKSVVWLELKNASLNQSMIDSLLGCSCDLEILLVNEDQNLNLNFDSILKCKRLAVFETNQSVQNSFDLAIKAFSRLTEFMYFIFKKDDETVEIRKLFQYVRTDTTQYMIRTSTFSKDYIEFNELITYCNRLANKTGVKTRSMTKLAEVD